MQSLKIFFILSFLLLVTIMEAYNHQQFLLDEQNSIQQRINAQINESTSTNVLEVSYSFQLATRNLPALEEILGANTLPALVKTFAIPAENVQLRINSMAVEVFSSTGQYLETLTMVDETKIYVEKSFTVREMRGFSVLIDLYSQESDLVKIISSADFTLHGTGYFSLPTSITESFVPVYSSLATNYTTSYLQGLDLKKPAMFILSHTSLANHTELNNFIRWKKSLGFDITVVNKTEAGAEPSAEQIRQVLKQKYEAAENKPEFLLIIGSARSTSETFYIPTFYQLSSMAPVVNVATDLKYGVLQDDSYFPEMLVGRFTGNNNNLNAMLWKTRFFEQGNLENSNDWLRRGAVIAGNYAQNSLPTSPRITSLWVRERMLEAGYTAVDSLFHDERLWQATTSDIMNSLNRGVQCLTYRGWGNAPGWHYPPFYSTDLDNLNNTNRMPYVYSMVCATGDFVNDYNPSFGEKFMRLGAQNDAKGAIAFLGPSYLHTNTPYNNSLLSGIIWGVYSEGIRVFGASVMRGRIEAYNNNPRELEMYDAIHFYWATYNMLSDPSLNMWIGIPSNMSANLPEQVNTHDNALALTIPGVSHGYATATRNNNDYTYARIVDGQAILPLPNTDEGDSYRITISARNYNPIIAIIPINSADPGIGLVSQEVVEGYFKATYTAKIELTLQNFSSVSQPVLQALLTSSSNFIQVLTTSTSIDFIAAGNTAKIFFEVQLADNTPNDVDIPFNLNLQPGNHNAKFSLISGSYQLEILSAVPETTNQNIGPGQSGDVLVTVTNPGTIPAVNIIGKVYSLTSAVAITQNTINFGTITPDGTASGLFSLSVQPDCFIGRQAHLYLDYLKGEILISRSYFNLTLGVVDQTAVLGPDQFGYFAYHSNSNYPGIAPEYEWVEINPEYGGTGTLLALQDDQTKTIDLPFTFRYYGIDHTQLSICDNGWAAFGHTEMTDFRNWNIPSALGPKNLVAVFWDDLKGAIDGADFREMNIKYAHDVTKNRFIVTWDDVYIQSDALQTQGNQEFQMILEPKDNANGDIILQYKKIINFSTESNFSTVGIENPSHFDGLCYTFSNFYHPAALPLQNGLAIRFTKTPPDNYEVSTKDQPLLHGNLLLDQNYPNPFNPQTNISFTLATNSFVSLEIYNIRGQKIKSLSDGYYTSGRHLIQWNGTNNEGETVGSGIYFYILETEHEKIVKKMLMLK